MLSVGESTEDARTQCALPPPPCASALSTELSTDLTADAKKICAARVLRTELKDLPIPLSQEVVIFLCPYGVRGRVILLELRVAEETVAGLGPSPGSLPTPHPHPSTHVAGTVNHFWSVVRIQEVL